MRAKMELNNFKLLETKQWSSLPREILTNTKRYFLTLQQLQSSKPGMWDQREVDETPGLQQSPHCCVVVPSCSKCLLGFPKLRVSYRIHTAWPHKNISWSSKSYGFGFKNKQTHKMKIKWYHFKGCQFLHITGDDLLIWEATSRSVLAFRK